MPVQRLIGPSGNIPFLIRDDDTNFFTKADMLESIYSDAWKLGFKVCLAVVPTQKGMDDICVPPSVRKSKSHFPITQNKALVGYLKDRIRNSSVEILQHGFSHEGEPQGRGEFGSGVGMEKEIELGRKIVTEAFKQQIKFFVPPGEDISNKNLNLLYRKGLVPIYRQSLFDTYMRNSFIPSFAKKMALKLLVQRYNKHNNSRNWTVRFVKPVFITVGKKTITWTPTVKNVNLSSFDSLITMTEKIIENCTANRNPVCIINHYHTYYYDWEQSITRRDLFDAWKNILTAFDKLKICWKVSFSELHNRVNQIQNVSIVKTGSKITIESERSIRDFSFRTNRQLENAVSIQIDKENRIATIENLSPGKKVVIYEK